MHFFGLTYIAAISKYKHSKQNDKRFHDFLITTQFEIFVQQFIIRFDQHVDSISLCPLDPHFTNAINICFSEGRRKMQCCASVSYRRDSSITSCSSKGHCCKVWVIAVSYTHLDVYKRQLLCVLSRLVGMSSRKLYFVFNFCDHEPCRATT